MKIAGTISADPICPSPIALAVAVSAAPGPRRRVARGRVALGRHLFLSASGSRSHGSRAPF